MGLTLYEDQQYTESLTYFSNALSSSMSLETNEAVPFGDLQNEIFEAVLDHAQTLEPVTLACCRTRLFISFVVWKAGKPDLAKQILDVAVQEMMGECPPQAPKSIKRTWEKMWKDSMKAMPAEMKKNPAVQETILLIQKKY
mgnify:CR=1 FL=1